jgi:GntR family transcriptional regulator/MocR family aminotransferase
MSLISSGTNSDNIPIYIQIYHYFKDEMIRGALSEGVKMPSIRKLAEHLNISTTPVEMAYDQLVSEGFIISRPKSGYYVQKIIEVLQSHKDLIKFKKERVLPRNLKFTYDFHISKNDFNFFPFNIWKRLYCECLNIDKKELLFYGDPQGEEGLRREIARYLRKYRGVECRPEQMIIGAEQHQLVTILNLILKSYGNKLAVEEPSYPLIHQTFQQGGYELCPIDLEEDGISMEKLYQSDAKIVCVSPSHQFPKGMLMPITKRLELLNWAKEVGGYIIEDDYDGEFRYHGRPIPALQGIIPNNHVIYLGGFSQILAPAICINYMVLPKALISIYKDIKFNILFEQASSRLHQKTMEFFIERGYLERHVRKMRLLYRQKHDRAVAALKRYFGEKMTILGMNAGFHLFLEIEHTKSEEELRLMAEKFEIRIATANYTWLLKKENRKREFILGFSGIEEDKIEEGIKLLSKVWFPYGSS